MAGFRSGARDKNSIDSENFCKSQWSVVVRLYGRYTGHLVRQTMAAATMMSKFQEPGMSAVLFRLIMDV
ncbi:MAG: hypothetical protein CMQ34_08985 [Gammaproteobacteria bacterium]|nr:hypothetical protein [Gammaproteobacteria bacterium]